MINVNAASTLLTTSVLPYLKEPWTISWIVSSLFAVFVPIIVWNSQKGVYYNSYGAYQQAQDYYEQKQWYYEQQQKQQNNGNYYGYNNNQQYKECSWFNWACRKRQYMLATYAQQNQGNNGDRVRENMPLWYVFLGGETEEMRRWREENGNEQQNGGRRNEGTSSTINGALKFAYFLTMVLFVALVVYGAKIIVKRKSAPTAVNQLSFMLIIASVVALMNLMMSVNTISADDRDIENSYYGWYGQTGILIVYTDFWIMLFSFGFFVAFQLKNFLDRRSSQKDYDHGAEKDTGDYHAPTDEPTMV